MTYGLIALTIYLNAIGAPDANANGEAVTVAERPLVVGVHIGGPIVVAGLVELLARAMAKRHRVEVGEVDRIPLTLWLVAFRESFRTDRKSTRLNSSH